MEEIIVKRDDDSFDLLYSRNIGDQTIILKDYVSSSSNRSECPVTTFRLVDSNTGPVSLVTDSQFALTGTSEDDLTLKISTTDPLSLKVIYLEYSGAFSTTKAYLKFNVRVCGTETFQGNNFETG
jgi:hypothetical protein